MVQVPFSPVPVEEKGADLGESVLKDAVADNSVMAEGLTCKPWDLETLLLNGPSRRVSSIAQHTGKMDLRSEYGTCGINVTNSINYLNN